MGIYVDPPSVQGWHGGSKIVEKKDKINIPVVMVSSEEFAEHCAAAVTSMLSNLSDNSSVDIYIYSHNMSKSTKSKISKLKHIRECNISFPHLDENSLDIFKSLQLPVHVNKLTYVRLLLPALYPQYDKILYIDADTLVRKDITDLYNIDIENNYFGAVYDANYKNLATRLWNDGSEEYFNCGILLINAKKLRDDNYMKLIEEKIAVNGEKYAICDQSIINDTFKGKIYRLELKWNFYHNEEPFCKVFTTYNEAEYEEALKDPAIVHFCGFYKPWYPTVQCEYKKEYFQYKKLAKFHKIFNYAKYQFFNTKYRVFSCCGRPVVSRIKNTPKDIHYKIFNVDLTNLTRKIFSIKKEKYTKIITILGIKFKFTNKIQMCMDSIKSLGHLIHTSEARSARRISNLKTIIQAQSLHPKTFGKYRNAFEGKDVVLVCTGPTAKNYKPIEGAIHVGVNGAIYLDQLKLDYLFIQDYAINQPSNKTLNQDANNYVGNNCQKFYGILPDTRLKEVEPTICRIPLNQCNSDNIHQYVLEDISKNNLAYNLEIEPLGEFLGTPFSAIQFILYCNPKRLYLVGCDCSSGYAYNKRSAIQPANYQVEIWTNDIKPFIEKYYANLEVISLNPIGLKGLFIDEYTN